MVDTCCDPTNIDYVIPANDDAAKSIAIVMDAVCAAIAEGSQERQMDKDKEAEAQNGEEGEAPVKKVRARRPRKEAAAEAPAETPAE